MSAFQRCGESLFAAMRGILGHVSAAGAASAQVTDAEGTALRFNQRDPSVRGLIAGRPLVHAEARELWRRSGWRVV